MQKIKNCPNQRNPRAAQSGRTPEKRRFKALLAVSSLHFLNDLHPTLLPTILPEIVKRLSLSLGEAGFLSTLFGILNLVVQPIAGQLADRSNRPVFALYAPLLTASGAYLLPVAPTYGIALLFVSLLGVGTASFHPQGHGLTGIVGGTERLGSYLAIFAAAGTLGSALSPLYAVFLLRTLGPGLMPLALIAVAAFILVAKRWIPTDTHEQERLDDGGTGLESTGEAKIRALPNIPAVMKICLALILISVVRDSTFQGIRVFLPLLVTGRGGSFEAGGAVLFAYTVAGSVANLLGGRMADRFGKMPIVLAMLSLAPVFMFPAIQADGMTAIALFILGGACISATNPVTLAMAQELVPASRSTASSLVMGVSWGMANIVASPIGIVADRIGLAPTLSIVSLAPLSVVAFYALGRFLKKKTETRT